jgi:hypothetical protein
MRNNLMLLSQFVLVLKINDLMGFVNGTDIIGYTL